MDRISNPYAPGAGAPPPALEGRDKIRENVRIAILRLCRGRAAQSVLMVGLRGVGKTVLLEQLGNNAEDAGAHTVWVEAPEDRSLPGILTPRLRAVLLRLSRIESAKALATRALRALAGFAGALRVKYADIEVRLDYDPEPGLADNGDLGPVNPIWTAPVRPQTAPLGVACRSFGITKFLSARLDWRRLGTNPKGLAVLHPGGVVSRLCSRTTRRAFRLARAQNRLRQAPPK